MSWCRRTRGHVAEADPGLDIHAEPAAGRDAAGWLGGDHQVRGRAAVTVISPDVGPLRPPLETVSVSAGRSLVQRQAREGLPHRRRRDG